MKCYFRVFLAPFLMFVTSTSVYGQQEKVVSDEISLEIPIFFGIGKQGLDASNVSNKKNLALLDELLRRDDLPEDVSVTISANASPDGNYQYNMNLTARRLAQLKNELKKYNAIFPTDRIIEGYSGIRWITLYEKVLEDTATPQRDVILSKLANTELIPTFTQDTTYVGEIKRLEPKTWDYLNKKKFPYMRTGIVKVDVPVTRDNVKFVKKIVSGEFMVLDVFGIPYDAAENPRLTQLKKNRLLQEQNDSIEAAQSAAEMAAIEAREATKEAARLAAEEVARRVAEDAARKVVEESACELEVKPLLALKTNLLYDVVAVPNIEVEVPLGNRWSIAGEWIFPWWSNTEKQHALQLLSGNLEAKYWFGDRHDRPVMTGWFAGVSAGGGLYDIEWDKVGRKGEFYMALAASGGYAHTINKKGTLRMEYALGLGYIKTQYYQYEAEYGPDDRWHLFKDSKGTFSWLGPTKLRVSLVWMLNTKMNKK